MTRVSHIYRLGTAQPSLPFVDVDVTRDVRVFVDPRALLLDRSDRGADCVSLVQDFFQEVLCLIRDGNDERARQLLGQLSEPNETHLGFSRGGSRGRGLGRVTARVMWESLRNSEAVLTGLLEDLEDTILMIEGISYDRVSDITTNLIREPLIHFTQQVCHDYGIPMHQVDSGPIWNPQRKRWTNHYVDLPVARGKLLLVPKEYVRQRMDYDQDEYYRHFILEYLREQELSDPNSSLVEVLKDGSRRVTKKSLMERYGTGKAAIVRLSREHPEVLDSYRRSKEGSPAPPLTHDELAEGTETELPDWDALLAAVLDVPAGAEDADRYHRAAQDLVNALFYPHLTQPRREWRIHEGRKRIDIVYTNVADDGFFRWVADHYGAPLVVVECKNYSRDVANPELDQLAGRFSPRRGRLGLLLCRSFEDKDIFMSRCHDTATDDRGYIVSLDDEDLKSLVNEAKDSARRKFKLLQNRFGDLIR